MMLCTGFLRARHCTYIQCTTLSRYVERVHAYICSMYVLGVGCAQRFSVQ